MSNLIIGFIGVTLFIGTILYGATFLGQNFEAGQDVATASFLITQMGAVANDVAKYEIANSVGTGAAVGNIATYTDAPVINPTSTSAAKAAELADSGGNGFTSYNAAGQATFAPAYVVVDLGQTAVGQSLCTSFASQTQAIARGSQVSATAVNFASGANRHEGCFVANYNSGSVASGDYVAYMKIG